MYHANKILSRDCSLGRSIPQSDWLWLLIERQSRNNLLPPSASVYHQRRYNIIHYIVFDITHSAQGASLYDTIYCTHERTTGNFRKPENLYLLFSTTTFIINPFLISYPQLRRFDIKYLLHVKCKHLEIINTPARRRSRDSFILNGACFKVC